MECKCGGSMKEGKAERSKSAAVLAYLTCRACGRNDYRALTVSDAVVAIGLEAQRAFLALEDGEPVPVPQPDPLAQSVPDPEAWRPVEQKPVGNGLVEVRFLMGGSYIERPSFFADRWDLIGAWRPYDNGPALRAAMEYRPIPMKLQIGNTPPPQQRAVVLPREEIPRGATYSLF